MNTSQESRKLNVLIADDDPLSLVAIGIQLEYMGYRVDSAKDGNEVLAAIAKRDYHLLIIDMHMGATNGLSTTLAIREAVPVERQPFIAILTGGVTMAELDALHKAGIDVFLEKPVTVYNLKKLLERACQGEPLPVPPERKASAQNQAPKTQPGSINFQVLHELLLLNSQRNGKVTDNFLALFFQTTPGLMQNIKETAQDRKLKELKANLHALRGSCEIYGAYRLSQLCKTLEKEVDQEVVENISEQVAGIETEYIHVVEILRIYQSTDRMNP